MPATEFFSFLFHFSAWMNLIGQIWKIGKVKIRGYECEVMQLYAILCFPQKKNEGFCNIFADKCHLTVMTHTKNNWNGFNSRSFANHSSCVLNASGNFTGFETLITIDCTKTMICFQNSGWLKQSPGQVFFTWTRSNEDIEQYLHTHTIKSEILV